MAAASRPSFTLEGHWASESDGRSHVVFNAEGIRCANCARSIQRGVGGLPGVLATDVNVVNGRVSVAWQTRELTLGTILGKVAELGFKPVPLVGEAAASERRVERRAALKRIGLAGLVSMQIMMYAGGLYSGAFTGIDPRAAEFLKLTCLLLATPVLFYSGAPILRGAMHDLRNRTLGMDVTVSLALLLAFAASVYDTLRGSGEVYFDSVTMFIFLLLLGRYFEMKGRHQAASTTDALARALPASVERLRPDGSGSDKVALGEVRVGDRLLIGSGQVVPVDGRIVQGEARVDESLVTGESMPQQRGRGEALLGGSLNVGAAVTLEVVAAPHDSTLHSLVRLLERAQSERPRIGLAAERMASWFILRILVLTAAVGVAWWFIDPARAFPAVLAVLVATCPCALSLATPVAIAAATSRLARLGILVTRSNAVEGLAHVDTVLLDKTGTLTAGAARVIETRVADDLGQSRALAIAAALETSSRHPIAEAFRAHARAELTCSDAQEIAGSGIEGTIGGETWRIGTAAFAGALTADPAAALARFAATLAGSSIVLGNTSGPKAAFVVSDELRADSRGTVEALRAQGLELQLASGDQPGPVAHVARELGITGFHARLRPEEKLRVLRERQAAGHKVLMIGDGINDGPVLAAADVSLAMGHGSSIAHAAGDLVLLRDSLGSLPRGIEVARQTLRVIRQNLRWAAGYNLAAVPLAALGLMPPWIAAIGMSVSSLVVVLNARRIAMGRDDAGGPPAGRHEAPDRQQASPGVPAPQLTPGGFAASRSLP